MNTLATASAWTSELTTTGTQVIEDIGVAIAAGLGIFAIVFGVRRGLGALKAASK
jgi:hypothetical protein